MDGVEGVAKLRIVRILVAIKRVVSPLFLFFFFFLS